MKAFFHRLHIGGGTKDKEKEASAAPKEKFPPLRPWPPEDTQRITSTSSSYPSFKPLPEVIPSQFSSQLSSRPVGSLEVPPTSESIKSTTTPNLTPASPQPTQGEDIVSETYPVTPPRADQDNTERVTRKPGHSTITPATAIDVQKKVAFISPPPTPVNFDRALPDAPGNGTSLSGPLLKTTVSRFQAAHGKEPRGPVNTAASSSKTDVATLNKTSVKATSTRTSSPYLQKQDALSTQSLRSGTPYSSMSNNSSGSRILSAQSWSEVTEEDLVSNIGSRERTRQEVLFEIISSEERYEQFFQSFDMFLIESIDMFKSL